MISYSKRSSEIFIEKRTYEEIVEKKILESNDENKLIDSYIDLLANFFREFYS